MSQTQQQDDDFIIINDEVETPIATPVAEKKTVSDDASMKTEESLEDFSLDFSSLSSETPTVAEKIEPAFPVEEVALNLTEEPVVEEKTNNLSGDSSANGDMNGILDGTIQKLRSRQENIRKKKKEEKLEVEQTQQEITKLQNHKKEVELDIKKLNVEDNKIEESVQKLEKMKLGEDDMKSHNEKRVVKKDSVKQKEVA